MWFSWIFQQLSFFIFSIFGNKYVQGTTSDIGLSAYFTFQGKAYFSPYRACDMLQYGFQWMSKCKEDTFYNGMLKILKSLFNPMISFYSLVASKVLFFASILSLLKSNVLNSVQIQR